MEGCCGMSGLSMANCNKPCPATACCSLLWPATAIYGWPEVAATSQDGAAGGRRGVKVHEGCYMAGCFPVTM